MAENINPNKSAEELEQEAEKEEEQNEKLVKKLGKSERTVKRYQWFLLRLLAFLLVVWILFFQVIGVVRMPSNDMYPRIDLGDMLIYYRLDKNVKAQEIVVLEKTTPDTPDEEALFVCRVIAVAGDTVDISDEGRLIVNGNRMFESNIFYSTPRFQGGPEFPLTLGEGECFVLADHRSDGVDSRYFGPVQKDEITGTVITIFRRNHL